mgnify:CR=1 FL=1
MIILYGIVSSILIPSILFRIIRPDVLLLIPPLNIFRVGSLSSTLEIIYSEVLSGMVIQSGEIDNVRYSLETQESVSYTHLKLPTTPYV